MSVATKTRGNDRRTQTERRPKMTAEQAQSFEGFSLSSMLQITEAIAQRAAEGTHQGCTCEPYADVFTFNRWKALGQSVKKGERALRIASFVPVRGAETGEGEDGEQGDAPKPKLRPINLILFCRCQVEKSKEYTRR
jgi:hypothetical protein